MRLSDLQNKDVVDIFTGEKIGNVIDVEVREDGTIKNIIIYDKNSFFGMIRGKDEISISWQQIKKIGSDVILVNRNI